MNLPNKLTVLRMILVPVFVFFVLYSFVPFHYVWALIIFAAASLTDHYDGKIARKRNQITDFGKFLDPLADKVLVISALVCFLQSGFANIWCVLIIIARELMITFFRLVAVENGKVIAANKWGKTKTISQMTAILFILTYQSLLELFRVPIAGTALALIGNLLIWIATFFTVFSAVIYIKQNIHVIEVKK